ncbi:MAG: hypothetical protein ABEJ89_09715 [Haloarculaceae archaeon]
MSERSRSLGRLAALAGYALAGAAGTAVVAVAAVVALQPLRLPVYHALYGRLDPWTAATTGTVLQFAVAGLFAVALPALLVEYANARGERLRPLAGGLAALLALVAVALLVTALAGGPGYPLLLAVVAVAAVALLAGARSLGATDATLATAARGGLPPLAALFLLLGFGLGWGGSHYLVAEAVDSGAVSGPVVSLADAPELEADLFSPGTCEDGDCYLALRDYAGATRAARLLDRHGVRCPYPFGPDPGDHGSAYVEHGGGYYRLTCVAAGD